MQVRLSRHAANSGKMPGNSAPCFSGDLRGDIDGALAQTLRIGLLSKGIDPVLKPLAGHNLLLQGRDGLRAVTDPADLHRVVGTLHCAPVIVMLASRLRQHLDALVRARNARDIDLTWHGLRAVLQRLEQIWDDGDALGHAGMILAPLLWRIRVLDAVHGTHIGDGFATLTARARALHGHAAVAQVLDRAAAQTYLDGLCGAHVARRDDGAE